MLWKFGINYSQVRYATEYESFLYPSASIVTDGRYRVHAHQKRDPFMEAIPNTVGKLLSEMFPGCDTAAGLTRVLTFVEAFANQLQAGLERVAIPICEWADRVESAAPVPGYEAMLIERGHHPLMARTFSYGLIRLGRDEANNARTRRLVADTLRFLEKPGRIRRSISRKAARLLEVWNATSPLSDAFHGSDVSVFEFVAALEGAVRGELAACVRMTEIAAAVAPGLSVRRGPKISEASITHQLLLQYVANTEGPKSYTTNPISGEYTEPLSRATGLAFSNPEFDPRPAFRRHRARRRQRSNEVAVRPRPRSKSPQLVPLD
jgi:hypothetical protein